MTHVREVICKSFTDPPRLRIERGDSRCQQREKRPLRKRQLRKRSTKLLVRFTAAIDSLPQSKFNPGGGSISPPGFLWPCSRESFGDNNRPTANVSYEALSRRRGRGRARRGRDVAAQFREAVTGEHDNEARHQTRDRCPGSGLDRAPALR